MSDKQSPKTKTIKNTHPELNPDQNNPANTPDQKAKTKKKKQNKKKKKNTDKQQAKTIFYDATGAPLSASKPPQAEPLTNHNYSPAESLPATPQTLLELPVKPDEWFIQPAINDDTDNEETLIFLKDGIEIVKLPLNEKNFGTLSQLLTERFNFNQDTTADYFHVRKPLTDSEESNPVITLTRKNRILATTSLDQKTLKRLIKSLQSHVTKNAPITTWLNNWWHKHKILRVLLIIGAIPFAIIFIYTVYWGSIH